MTGGGRLDRRLALALLGVFAVLVFLPGLGNHDLWAPDEPRYAQVSREMLQGGDWLLPRVNDRIYTDKPPGYFWLVALASLPGGDVSAFTARLPSAVMAVMVLLLVAWWGERHLGRGSGPAAAVVLATTFLFFDLGRSTHLDMQLTLLVTVALFSADAIFRQGAGPWARLLFWVAGGLAILVKGPVGLLLPLLVVTADRVLARRPRELLRLQPWWGFPLAAMLPIGWLMAVAFTHAAYDPMSVIQRHVLTRFGSGLHHARPFWYYGVHFFTELAPWSFVVPAAAVAAWRFGGKPPGAASRPRDQDGLARRRFLVVWTVGIVLFFSISTEKRGLYITPMVPAAALLVGDAWRRLRQRELKPGVLLYAGLAIPAALLTLLALLPEVLARRPVAGAPRLPDAVMVAAGCGAVGGVLCLVALVRRRPPLAMSLLAAATLATLLAYVHLIMPALDPVKSSRRFAGEVAAARGPGDPVAMQHWRASLLYYSGINMVELGGDEETVAWAAAGDERRLLILRHEAWQRLQDRLPGLQELASHGEGSRRRILLERRPRPAAGPPGG